MIPGEIIIKNKEIICNEGKEIISISVFNDSDRPIQVGSHFHFFEANKKLKFPREAAFGKRLNIASGTGLRFEPGEKREVELIEIGGEKAVYGFNNLTCGKTTDAKIKNEALKAAVENNFSEGGE